MPPANNLDLGFWLIAGILLLFFFVLILFSLVSHFAAFCEELKYLDDEIKRTSGDERRYWRREKRRLWLSLIPFVKYR